MTGMRVGALCWLVLFGVAVPASADEKVHKAEMKWARGVADDFWEALLNTKDYYLGPGIPPAPEGVAQAAALLSPEFSEALTSYEWDGKQTRKLQPPAYLRAIAKKYICEASVAFTSAEMAPGGGEVIFQGVVSGTDPDEKKVRQVFKMRVAKVARSGKWGIRYLRLKDRKGEAPTKKGP
jgi:hypothetical protein